MVRTAAIHDPILQDLLNQAIIYWKLKYDHGQDDRKDKELDC